MGKYIGNGTTVKITTAISTSSTAAAAKLLGTVLSIDGPTSDAPDIDMGTLDSTGYMPSRKGIPTTGDITITCGYDPGSTAWGKVKTMAEKHNTVGTLWVIFANVALSEEGCNVYVKGVGRSIARDAMMTRTITVHPSSAPNWN